MSPVPGESSNERPSSPGSRLRSLDWWVRDKRGRMAIAQPVNPALGVWVVGALIGWMGFLGPARSTVVSGVAQGALIVWAVDELLRGTAPVRRLLGAVVLAVQLVRLFA